MLRLCATLFAVSLSFVTAAPPTPEDSNEAFQRGLAAYQKHDFTAARDHFRDAVARGPVTARMLHNLALAHYQSNQRAFALAYWRKALRLDPSYAAAGVGRDLLENHMHMRPFERPGPDLIAARALERVPSFATAWALAVLIAAFAWRIFLQLQLRRAARDEDRDPPRWAPTTFLLGGLMLATATLLTLKLWYGTRRLATVVGEKVSVKSLPNDESATLFELPTGGEVLVRRGGDGWRQVQTAEGTAGWVRDADVIVTSDD